MIRKSSISYIVERWAKYRVNYILKSFLIGILTGIFISLFRIGISKLLSLLIKIYETIHKNILLIIPWTVFLIIVGLLIGYLVRKEPLIKGSGIPQIKGKIIGYIEDMAYLKIFFLKFLGTILSVGSGLSLGREGPSIQIGASIGGVISKISKCTRIEEKYLVTCGASAGLASAFNAPLAGTIFALEELHKNFSPLLLTSVMLSSLSSAFVTYLILGPKVVFNIRNLSLMPLDKYFYLIFLGIALGILGKVFNESLLKFQEIYKKQKIKNYIKPIIPILFSIIIGFYLPEILGGGDHLIEDLINKVFSIKFLVLLFIIKFIFTMISYGSGAPGGIFMPLLAIGSIIGAIYGKIVISIANINTSFLKNFIVFAMSGYFSAIVGAPITGLILITEMTGNFNHLFPSALVSIVAYIISIALKNSPIYDSLLERIIEERKISSKIKDQEKVIFEILVPVGSPWEGKRIKDINLPKSCLIIGIKRGESEILPKGDTIILPGDYVVILTEKENEVTLRKLV